MRRLRRRVALGDGSGRLADAVCRPFPLSRRTGRARGGGSEKRSGRRQVSQGAAGGTNRTTYPSRERCGVRFQQRRACCPHGPPWPHIVDFIKNREIHLIVNTPAGKQSNYDDSYPRWPGRWPRAKALRLTANPEPARSSRSSSTTPRSGERGDRRDVPRFLPVRPRLAGGIDETLHRAGQRGSEHSTADLLLGHTGRHYRRKMSDDLFPGPGPEGDMLTRLECLRAICGARDAGRLNSPH